MNIIQIRIVNLEQQPDAESIENIINRITEKLETMAVPIDEREFTIDEYRKVFPQGTVKTPIGKVKIGKNQFSKLAEKDDGKRQGLIGAMYLIPLRLFKRKKKAEERIFS